MNEPQESMLGEQPPHPKANFKDTPIAKVLPLTLAITLLSGFGGRGTYDAIGTITGWGTYTIATFCLGTLIACIVGGFIGGVSQMILNSFGKEVKV